ncbi:homoserine O-acetyltransferase [Neoconidiobolus thromboides FSU 785]|nr:homoserine O-acetyltransferase [Neoconidiobolus thromboides FSU 785]
MFSRIILAKFKVLPAHKLIGNHTFCTSSKLGEIALKCMEFPCIDKLEERNRSFNNGPEPEYDKVVSGYKLFKYENQFEMDYGTLPRFQLAYETWGQLNENKDNAILIHTGLSGSSHAKSHENNLNPGWWEKFIGPGLSIDTNKFFVVCTNVLGGCYGSTGPSSIDDTIENNTQNKKYGSKFPILTIFDMVRAQFKLLDHLGIQRLHASIGSSMGGMQSLAAAILFRDRVNRIVSISSCAKSHPYSIALRHVQRQVLMTDPNYNKGDYYGKAPPHVGMKLAREIATITYRSGPEWEKRFGLQRQDESVPPALCPDFLIETYLDHQGEKFCLNYDANSLLYISKAMDMFDLSLSNLKKLNVTKQHLSEEFKRMAITQDNDLELGLKIIADKPILVLGVQSDILFPSWQQKEIASKLKKHSKHVHYFELDAEYGHDTFLIDLNNVGPPLKGLLEQNRESFK